MKNIIENNKLIAEFMGLEKEDRYLSFKTGSYCKKDNDSCYPDPVKVFIKNGNPVITLKYHTSWDWLMPVVNKIRGLYNNTEVMHSDIIDDLAEGCVEANIIQAHNAVVEFIKWDEIITKNGK